MNAVIMGGGLAGISLAYFLQDREDITHITILEKDDEIGGLCRSLRADGYIYDIGPHILFSKDKEMLNLMLDVLGDNKNELRRSNQIIYKGRWVQYPFENDLSKLPEKDLKYCIESFLHNPYEHYEATNMLQFFLKTFGEGITNCYLRPYNEKIWKYDPSFMNTSMVDRIPKPGEDDIMRSANGETVDGYLHQLYFRYPAEGGIESVIKGFARRLDPSKCCIHTKSEVVSVKREGGKYQILSANGEEYSADLAISTIPVNELAGIYHGVKSDIKGLAGKLRYNSIIIAFIKTREDLCGDNFAFMIPDKEIIFHRISKMDFLGSAYKSDGATYMVEITYREKDQVDSMSEEDLFIAIKAGVRAIGFAKSESDIEIINLTRHKYAYVIYDLEHTLTMEGIRMYFKEEGMVLHGRFGNFEYWNMDRVVRESKELSEKIMPAM